MRVGRVSEVDRKTDARRDIRRSDPVAAQSTDSRGVDGGGGGLRKVGAVDARTDRGRDRRCSGDCDTGVVRDEGGFDDQVDEWVHRDAAEDVRSLPCTDDTHRSHPHGGTVRRTEASRRGERLPVEDCLNSSLSRRSEEVE